MAAAENQTKTLLCRPQEDRTYLADFSIRRPQLDCPLNRAEHLLP